MFEEENLLLFSLNLFIWLNKIKKIIIYNKKKYNKYNFFYNSDQLNLKINNGFEML